MSEFTNTPKLVLLPAVDVADGKAVRLTQGEAGSETSYGDPVDAAAEWADAGAEWIHLVDLDAAFGRGSNRDLLKKVIRQTKGVSIELSGGIRDDESLEQALEIGATRVNLGTAALENPEWAANVIGRYGEAIAVGLDVRGTTLAARGWTRDDRRHQGRHPQGPEPRPAARGHGAHRAPRRRLRRHLQPRRHRGAP